MRIKKILANVMCASMILSNLTVASASNVFISESPIDEINIATVNENSSSTTTETGWTTDESNVTEIEVSYKQASSYSVTIPKTITLDSKKQAIYSIKVTGDIDTNQRVYVAPVDGISETNDIDFYMKDATPDSRKSDVTATVTQNKYYWSSEEVTNGYEESDNSISAPDLTSGSWKGTFQVEIKLQTEQAHEHNFVDGKCTCGEVDPNHTHNYVDSTCTICNQQEAGLYDADGIMLASWEESGIDNTCSNATGIISNYPKTTKVVISDSVTSIDKLAFYNCTLLTDVVIGNSVTSIGAGAFYKCTSLTEVEIPDPVTGIDKQAFAKCTSLTDVVIGNSVTSIGEAAFEGCTLLTEVEIPDSVTSIGISAFANCTLLTEVEIPDSVTSIGESAFFCCKSLTDIVIPDSVTSIGSAMFSSCESLTEVEIPDSVTSIGKEAFKYCTSLKNVIIPNSVSSIENYAFAYCTSLTDVVIPNSVTSIGQYAFSNVPHITYNGTATGSPWGAKSIN